MLCAFVILIKCLLKCKNINKNNISLINKCNNFKKYIIFLFIYTSVLVILVLQLKIEIIWVSWQGNISNNKVFQAKVFHLRYNVIYLYS